jgi:hypothetical protein
VLWPKKLPASAHQHGLCITAFNYPDSNHASKKRGWERKTHAAAGDGVGDWNTSCLPQCWNLAPRIKDQIESTADRSFAVACGDIISTVFLLEMMATVRYRKLAIYDILMLGGTSIHVYTKTN